MTHDVSPALAYVGPVTVATFLRFAPLDLALNRRLSCLLLWYEPNGVSRDNERESVDYKGRVISQVRCCPAAQRRTQRHQQETGRPHQRVSRKQVALGRDVWHRGVLCRFEESPKERKQHRAAVRNRKVVRSLNEQET